MVYKNKYSWRNGMGFKQISADTVGNALEKIEERDGEVSSRSFLEYSRPEESETHCMFEWDDSIAAEKYRLVQSGKIIGQLQVEIITIEQSEQTLEIELEKPAESRSYITPAFVNVRQKTQGENAAYRNMVSAMENEQLRRQVLLNANNELQAFARKYQQYQEFAGVIAEIRKVII